jgi:hypothetical protein
MRLWISDKGKIRIKVENDREERDLRAILPFHGYYNPKRAVVTLRRAREEGEPASGAKSPTRSFRDADKTVAFTPKGDHKPTLCNYRTFVHDYETDGGTLRFVLPNQKKHASVATEEMKKTEAFKNAMEAVTLDLMPQRETTTEHLHGTELRAAVQKLNQLLNDDPTSEAKIENGRVAVYRMVRID